MPQGGHNMHNHGLHVNTNVSQNDQSGFGGGGKYFDAPGGPQADTSPSGRLKIIMNNQNKYCCEQILKANKLLQTGQQEDAYNIIQVLLDKEDISFEYRESLSQDYLNNQTGANPNG